MAEQNTELMVIAGKIKECVHLLEKARPMLHDAAMARAVAIAEYDRDVGVCAAKVELGEIVMVEDKAIQNPRAAMAKELVKGSVWKSKFALEKAEAHYKVVLMKIDSIKAMLMGLQSIYKRLDVL